MAVALCTTTLSTTAVAQQTAEKLVAIHYSENMGRKDSAFAYDPCGNVTLRMTDDWREENTYDREGRRTGRKIYAEYQDEMKLESEQAWTFDEQGRMSLERWIGYNVTSGRIASDVLHQMTYDDECHIWTEDWQKLGQQPTRNEHWYDEAGRDTLVNNYRWNAANETWALTSHTLTSYEAYGMTCQLVQYLINGLWVNSERVVAEYHGSADSYKLTREYYFVEDSTCPDTGEWEDGAYEYNYLRQNNALHIWGCEEGRRFDDEYVFDTEGREVSHTNHYASSHSSETTTHEYDAQGNLVNVTETETWAGDITTATSHRYTYDDCGALLTAENLIRDMFDTNFAQRSLTVYDYDTSVPASAVYGCPSDQYKLLSITETDRYGNRMITTYEYEAVDTTEAIRQLPTPEADQLLPCYDLQGRRVRPTERTRGYWKDGVWLVF